MIRKIGKVLVALIVCPVMIYAGGATDNDDNSCDEFARLDKELNRLCQKVLKEYSLDAAFCKKFEASQKAWENYRDTYIESLFPDDDKKNSYGSSFENCICAEKADLTKDRIDRVIVWLEGSDDPDACISGIKRVAEQKTVVTLEDLGYCWISTSAVQVYAGADKQSKTVATVSHGMIFETIEIGDETEEGSWIKVRFSGEFRPGSNKSGEKRKPVTGWIFGKLSEIIRCK